MQFSSRQIPTTVHNSGVTNSNNCPQFRGYKFQQLSTIQGLICIVSDVGVPKVVSAFGLSRVRISGVRANAFPIRGIQDLR